MARAAVLVAAVVDLPATCTTVATETLVVETVAVLAEQAADLEAAAYSVD